VAAKKSPCDSKKTRAARAVPRDVSGRHDGSVGREFFSLLMFCQGVLLKFALSFLSNRERVKEHRRRTMLRSSPRRLSKDFAVCFRRQGATGRPLRLKSTTTESSAGGFFDHMLKNTTWAAVGAFIGTLGLSYTFVSGAEARVMRAFKESEARTNASFKESEARTNASFKESEARTNASFKESEARTNASFKELNASFKELEGKVETKIENFGRELSSLTFVLGRLVGKVGVDVPADVEQQEDDK